jgi:hypothetical protein
MLTLKQLRAAVPDLRGYSDDELEDMRDHLYEMARLLLRMDQLRNGSTESNGGSCKPDLDRGTMT